MRLSFCKALVGLLLFDLMLLGRNFTRMHRIVLNRKVNKKKRAAQVTREICDALDHACVWYPKRALCLQRSAVMTCLLRSAGVPAQMVIGAQKLPFKAHAWVEVDGRVVNEKTDVQSIYGVWERC